MTTTQQKNIIKEMSTTQFKELMKLYAKGERVGCLLRYLEDECDIEIRKEKCNYIVAEFLFGFPSLINLISEDGRITKGEPAYNLHENKCFDEGKDGLFWYMCEYELTFVSMFANSDLTDREVQIKIVEWVSEHLL